MPKARIYAKTPVIGTKKEMRTSRIPSELKKLRNKIVRIRY